MFFRQSRRLAAFIVLTLSGVAAAQTFPSKPLRLVVPFTTGRTSEPAPQTLAGQIGRVVGDAEFRNRRLLPFTFVPAPPGRECFRQVLRPTKTAIRR